MKHSFVWSKSKQLSILQIILAFALPSLFAYTGFRFILPHLVSYGHPKVLMWGIVASVMLFILLIIGVYLNYSESKKLNISLLQRLCVVNSTKKQWLIYIAIFVIGIAITLLAKSLIKPFMSITRLQIPDYMPFWLDPLIDPMKADINTLSPGYPLKGNYTFLIVMTIALLLNILAEGIYFRAWLMPKMSFLGKWSWLVNGFLFALYHTFQLWLFPILLVGSLTTAFIIYKSKSILPAFIIHLVANFLMSMLGILYFVIGL